MIREVDRRADVNGLVKGLIEAPRIQNVQLIADLGVLPAFDDYEFLVAALQQEGYDLVADPFAGNVEITGDIVDDEKSLPSTSLVHLRDMAEKLRRTVVEASPAPDELDAMEERYRAHLVRWFEHLTFQGMMRAPRPIVLPLEDDVRSNSSVRRLAANPLMLTMLALLRRQVGRLPHRRIQLYESYELGTFLSRRWSATRRRTF